MAINDGVINAGVINAPAAAPALPVQQVPLNLSNQINNPPLAVVQVPLNLSNQVNPPAVEGDVLQQAALPVDAEAEQFGPLIVDASVTAPLPNTAEVALTSPAPLTELVEGDLEGKHPLDNSIPVEADLESLPELVIDGSVTAPAGLLPLVEGDLDGSAPLTVTVEGDLEGVHDLADPPIEGDLKGVYSLLEEAAVSVTGAITLTTKPGGQSFEIIKGSIESDQGSPFWQATIELANPGDGETFSFDDEVEVSIFGTPFCMVVDSRQLSRDAPDVGELEQAASLRLVSISARTDIPRATPFTGAVTPSKLASAAAAEVLGQAITWNLIDWFVPDNVVTGDAASPIQIAQQIAAAAGGVVESLPDGTLVARDLFPVPVADYPTGTPKHIYTEEADIFQTSDDFQFDDVINRLRIRNASDGEIRDAMTFEADDADGRTGVVSIFPTPFRTLDLQMTSDTDIAIVPLGVTEVTIEQTIEFRDGQGSANRPVFAIDSVGWLDDDLGPVTFTVDDNRLFTAAGAGDPVGFSLADVTFRARALQFQVTSTKDDRVQFLAIDCPGSTGGVDLIAIRGAGDIDGGEIVDPLIATQLVALNRARNEMDEQAEPKVPINLTTKFRTDVLNGDFVEVNDNFRNMVFRGKVTSVQHIIDSGAAITNLTVERVEAF